MSYLAKQYGNKMLHGTLPLIYLQLLKQHLIIFSLPTSVFFDSVILVSFKKIVYWLLLILDPFPLLLSFSLLELIP